MYWDNVRYLRLLVLVLTTVMGSVVDAGVAGLSSGADC